MQERPNCWGMWSSSLKPSSPYQRLFIGFFPLIMPQELLTNTESCIDGARFVAASHQLHNGTLPMPIPSTIKQEVYNCYHFNTSHSCSLVDLSSVTYLYNIACYQSRLYYKCVFRPAYNDFLTLTWTLAKPMHFHVPIYNL